MVDHIRELILPKEYLLESHTLFNHCKKINKSDFLFTWASSHLVENIFDQRQINLVHFSLKTQNFCIYLPQLWLEQFFLSKNADCVGDRQGDKLLLLMIVIHSFEVCVRQHFDIKVELFPTHLDSVLIKIVRVFLENAYRLRDLYLSFSQEIETVWTVSLSIDKLSFLHFDHLHFLYHLFESWILE